MSLIVLKNCLAEEEFGMVVIAAVGHSKVPADDVQVVTIHSGGAVCACDRARATHGVVAHS